MEAIKAMLRNLTEKQDADRADQAEFRRHMDDNMNDIKARMEVLETAKSRRASPTPQLAQSPPRTPVQMLPEPTAQLQSTLQTPTPATPPEPTAQAPTPAPQPDNLAPPAGEQNEIDSEDEYTFSDEDDEDPMFGPTGLPKTPAPGKKRKSGVSRPSKKRETLHMRSLIAAKAIAYPPVMHGKIKSADYISYNARTIAAFIKFWDDIRTYMLQEKVEPPFTTLIHKDIIRRLIADNYDQLSKGRFGELTMDGLYAVMQKEFRPKDRLDFIKKLDVNVSFEFTSHYSPTAQHFLPFYDAVLLYMSRFNEVFDILVFGMQDRVDIIPRCDNKPGGLVKGFISKIPYQFGTNLLFVLTAQRWRSLPSFFRDFRAMLDQCKADSECARRVGRLITGTRHEAEQRASKKADHKVQQLLQQMQELERRAAPVDPEPEFEFEDRYDVDEDEPATTAADDENALDTMLAAAMYPARTKDSPQKHRAGKPAHDSSPAPREPLVCLTKILHGVCNKKPCNFSHNEQQVSKKRRELIEMMLKQDAAEKSSGAARPSAPQKFSALLDPEEDY